MSSPTILDSLARVAQGKPSEALASNVTSIVSSTAFVHGEGDKLVPARHARFLHERRVAAGKASVFALVPNAGHMLPLTHPELVAQHAREEGNGS